MRQSKLRWDEVRKGNMNCCYSVGRWMTGTRLKLNNDKTAAVLADRTGRSACDKTSTWQLVIMTLPWKVISKILGSTLMLLCLWWSILATSVEHVYGEACWPHQTFSVSRDQKKQLYPPSPDDKSYCSADVFVCSQSVGLLQLFAYWHHGDVVYQRETSKRHYDVMDQTETDSKSWWRNGSDGDRQ